MDRHERITADPAVRHGVVCIRGTRIPVAVILDNLAVGMSGDDVLAHYPSLQPEDVRAAIAYAADLVRERLLPLRASA